MTATSAALAGRRAAEALMVDTCSIDRPDGVGAIDEADGRVGFAWVPVIGSTACRIQIPEGQADEADVPMRTATRQRYVVSIPAGSGAEVRVDDRVQITTSAIGRHLAGRYLRVVGVHQKTHATAQRLQCEEITA